MVESMITGVIDLSSFDAANLFALGINSVMEGLAHDPFACALQALFGCLVASH